MSRVAGTRLWSRPARSSRTAPGSEATKFTVIATGAMRRLNRNWSPALAGRRASRPGSRRLGMKT